VLATAPLLAGLGIDMVLGSPPGGDLQAAWSASGLAHIPLELPSHAGIRAENGDRSSLGALAAEFWATSRGVPRVARAVRAVDVVHSNSLWGHLDCAIAGRLARRPVVLELHDLVRPGVGRRILSTAARLSSVTLAISTSVARVIGDGSDRVRVVHPAVDLRRFAPGPADPSLRRLLTDDPDALLIGIVGRIDPMKGIDVLIRAMAQLNGSAAAARLVVVGSPGLDTGGYEQQVRKEADRLVGSRARFVGRIDEVPEVLRSLDILVNASAEEPFGLTVLEAQASGVPIVAPASGGLPDFVTDGDNGLLVPPGDVGALAGALERLLGDAELRQRLGRRGRETAAADHGLPKRAEILARVYRAAARGESVPCAR
jgi:glycosyltransferase involved in cell wall biosynthesis